MKGLENTWKRCSEYKCFSNHSMEEDPKDLRTEINIIKTFIGDATLLSET